MTIRKGIYFFPALMFLLFLIWASIALGIKSLEMSAILVEILFVLAGFLLSKRLIIGGVIGFFPSVYFVLSGNYSKTGIETPVGIVLFIYYLLCIVDIHMNKKGSLEKFRNMLLIIAIVTTFLSSLYFFFRIRDYMIAICFFIAFLLLMMLNISQHKK